MIYFGSLHDIDYNRYDQIWLVVRSPKKAADILQKHPDKVIHHPILSPSFNLFMKYDSLRKAGLWNDGTFKTEYVPQFLSEMHTYAARQELNSLYAQGSEKDILCVCFCPNETICHRTILRGILQHAETRMGRTGIVDRSLDTEYYGRAYAQYYGFSK